MVDRKRVGRWVVPVSVASLAVAGVVFLGAMELQEGQEAGQGGQTAWEEGAPEAGALSGDARSARRSAGHERGARTLPSARSQAGSEQGVAARRTGASETDSGLAASNLLLRLVRGRDLAGRIRILDDYLGRARPSQALTELEGLVTSTLPGSFAESEQLRLAVISRLGRFDDPRASGVLLARLDVNVPRPQRLLAIELLAPREAAQGRIGALAEHDDDPKVVEKARWALQRSR